MIGKTAIPLFVTLMGVPDDAHRFRQPIENWFKAVGPRQSGETFGELSLRAAKLKLGTPYDSAPQTPGPEKLRIELEQLHCVSLVEYANAIARCLWKKSATSACFLAEVESTRYRNGHRNDYASRLHYFSEWLLDNQRRGRLHSLVEDGTPITAPYFFMSQHKKRYPSLQDHDIAASIAETENRLSRTELRYVPKNEIRDFQKNLQTGDIIAVVSSKPGLLITHVGFAVVDPLKKVRLLHASSHNNRVVISRGDIAGYVMRRSERRGIIAARPLAPHRRGD